MEIPPLLALVLALAFVGLNAFYVLAEFAIVKVRATRVRELRAGGSHEAHLLATHILPRLDAYLAVCQIGITVASLALGWIGEPATAWFLHRFLAFFLREGAEVPHGVSFGVAFTLVMGVHVLFGELVPKSIAILSPTRAALLAARPLRWSYRAFYPFFVGLNAAANGIVRLAGLRGAAGGDAAHSEEELRYLLASSKDRGVLDPGLFTIIDNAFNFRGRTVAEVMVPREKVAVISLARPWKENLELVKRMRHTRYPLVVSSLDDPVGLVHIKDLLLRGIPIGREPNLMRVRRELMEVPPDTRLERAMTLMRGRGAHLMLVRAKGGGILGIVCLEDVVETIVGRLEDEFDREERTTLADLLVPAAVVPEFEAVDRREVFARAIAHLHAIHPHFDLETALREVERREDQISTAIGGGVGVPHAILEELGRPLLAIVRTRGAVPFASIDGRPVALIFLFLIPGTNPGLRPRMLGDVAWIAQRAGVVERAAAAKSAEEVVATLVKALAAKSAPPPGGFSTAPAVPAAPAAAQPGGPSGGSVS